jgi:hypothetical protein
MGLFGHSYFWLSDTLEADRKENEVKKEFRIKFSSNKDRKVLLIMNNSDVRISGYDGDEVIIEADGTTSPPERAAGLKPLYNTAEDNSGIGLSVTEENNTVKIIKATMHRRVNYRVKVPKKITLVFEEPNHHGTGLTISDIEGRVEVETKSSAIHLNNISGSVKASSISGNVTVVFANVNQEEESSIKVISSIVDISLPPDTKADLRMKSITGEVFTDFDLALNDHDKNGLRRVAGNNLIEGKANGGGVAMNIETISSDIFIRKRK